MIGFVITSYDKLQQVSQHMPDYVINVWQMRLDFMTGHARLYQVITGYNRLS